MTGGGGCDYEKGLFTLKAQVSGEESGAPTCVRDDNEDTLSVTGEYDGQAVDLKQ